MYQSEVFEHLVGRTIRAEPVVQSSNLHIQTDAGLFVFGAEGDCCARCYWSEIENPADVVGSVVTGFECGGWNVDADDDGDVRETCFVTLRTSAGVITATLRLSHNGYYCGWPTLEQSP